MFDRIGAAALHSNKISGRQTAGNDLGWSFPLIWQKKTPNLYFPLCKRRQLTKSSDPILRICL